MSYQTGGNIQATDYNTFEALADGINEIFADPYPYSVRDSVTYPVLTNDPVTYGYGQPLLAAPVTAGSPVTAVEWQNLFQTFAKVGQHQNTPVVPPLGGAAPGFGTGTTLLPSPGDLIAAYNTPPGAVATLLGTLKSNRLLLSTDSSQRIFTAGTGYTSASSWTTTLTYTTQMKFGTATNGYWQAAKHFFNSGGFVGISGSWPGAASPVELAYQTILNDMSPLKFDYDVTTTNVGSGALAVGFYDLTDTYQNIYYRMLSGYTGAGYVQVEAKLDSVAGTNGLVDFRITLQDNDLVPGTKTTPISFSLSNTRTAGAVVVYNPAVSAGTFTYA